MIASVNEALALLNVQPGETFRTTVNGCDLEVRALGTGVATKPTDEATRFAEGEMMLEPWFTVPPPHGIMVVQAKLRPLPWPDPPVVEHDNEEVG